MKGNVIDLAIAVVIGAAFGRIVTSLVDNIITPFVGLLLGGVDFSELSFGFRDAVFGYGAFIQSAIDFIIVALVLFVVIKSFTRLKKKEAEVPAEKPAGPSQEQLLTEIRDLLKK